MTPASLKIGAQNLLINCAELRRGDSLLIILEDPELGWYKKDVAEAIIAEASELEITVNLITVPGPTNKPDNDLTRAMADYDCTIFFARIGDQDRFEFNSCNAKRVMSYARSAESLASSFGTSHYKGLQELKRCINSILVSAKVIDIRCPKGTSIVTQNAKHEFDAIQDVTIRRFPVVVPAPMDASLTSGKVVLDNYLTPTGSKVYQPESLQISSPVEIYVHNGKIDTIIGDEDVVQSIKRHYMAVAAQFNLSWETVHSWHAGIHPGVFYNHKPEINPDRWSNTLFASPKFLHFHTCGDYAPGEICWMIENPSIFVDGKSLWHDGVLRPEIFDKSKDCLEKWPDLQKLFVG